MAFEWAFVQLRGWRNFQAWKFVRDICRSTELKTSDCKARAFRHLSQIWFFPLIQYSGFAASAFLLVKWMVCLSRCSDRKEIQQATGEFYRRFLFCGAFCLMLLASIHVFSSPCECCSWAATEKDPQSLLYLLEKLYEVVLCGMVEFGLALYGSEVVFASWIRIFRRFFDSFERITICGTQLASLFYTVSGFEDDRRDPHVSATHVENTSGGAIDVHELLTG